jgi:hypothetical protein
MSSSSAPQPVASNNSQQQLTTPLRSKPQIKSRPQRVRKQLSSFTTTEIKSSEKSPQSSSSKSQQLSPSFLVGNIASSSDDIQQSSTSPSSLDSLVEEPFFPTTPLLECAATVGIIGGVVPDADARERAAQVGAVVAGNHPAIADDGIVEDTEARGHAGIVVVDAGAITSADAGRPSAESAATTAAADVSEGGRTTVIADIYTIAERSAVDSFGTTEDLGRSTATSSAVVFGTNLTSSLVVETAIIVDEDTSEAREHVSNVAGIAVAVDTGAIASADAGRPSAESAVTTAAADVSEGGRTTAIADIYTIAERSAVDSFGTTETLGRSTATSSAGFGTNLTSCVQSLQSIFNRLSSILASDLWNSSLGTNDFLKHELKKILDDFQSVLYG